MSRVVHEYMHLKSAHSYLKYYGSIPQDIIYSPPSPRLYTSMDRVCLLRNSHFCTHELKRCVSTVLLFFSEHKAWRTGAPCWV